MEKKRKNPLQRESVQFSLLCEQLALLLPGECSKAQLLGIDDILAYRHPRKRRTAYHRFEIPKKSGGTREIVAPDATLKAIQRIIGRILQGLWTPADQAHGFALHRSVVTGAAPHVGALYVFNIDLLHFFDSIRESKVFNSLMAELRFDIPTAALITDLCTLPVKGAESILPQGAPSSPVLSNIVCARLDRRLSRFAAIHGLTYTRYADDITFSGPYNAFRGGTPFLYRLQEVIRDEGFSINDDKTRLQTRGARQEVTGLTVCKKVNVSRKWLKRLRAQIHRMEVGGATPEELRSACGKVAWLRHVRGGPDPCSHKLLTRLRALDTAPGKI